MGRVTIMLAYKYQVVRYISLPKNCTSQVLGVFQSIDDADAFISLTRDALNTGIDNVNLSYTIRLLDARGRAPRDENVTVHKYTPIEVGEE